MNIVLAGNPTLADLMLLCREAPEDIQDQWEAISGTPWCVDAVVSAVYTVGGPKWVGHVDGYPIAAGGFIPIRPGVYRDWLIPGPFAFTPAYWRSVTKICRRIMDSMLLGDAHRLECLSLASRANVVDWYRVLGYQFEGTLHAAGSNGEDLAAYCRLRKDYGPGRQFQRGEATAAG